MDKVYGRKVQEIVINMKGLIQTIKNGDMVYSLGLLEIYTKEITNRIRDTDMERCFGQMAVITKETGIRGSSMEKVWIFD